MNPFAWREGALFCEDVAVERIAEEIEAPFYLYSANAMRSRCRALIDAFAHRDSLVCYALKANHNLEVIRSMLSEGAGVDTVSAGEIARARAAGAPGSRIVFAGVAKDDAEIGYALDGGVLQFNVESAPELMRIAEIAASRGIEAPIALRVNPGVASGGHEKISTGREKDKFGVPIDEAPELLRLASRLPGARPIGLHLHIGSQILETAPFERAWRSMAELHRAMVAEGLPLAHFDLGGGIGVAYADGEDALEARAFAAAAERSIAGVEAKILIEPGRSLVAAAGALIARVIYVKETRARRFAILDAGMNALIRPALYGARHRLAAVRPRPGPTTRYDVVGPICESSDVFGRDYALPPLARRDLLAFFDAGAYSAVMASDYNTRPSPAQVLVDGARYAIIKPRREPEAQFADEIAQWSAPP